MSAETLDRKTETVAPSSLVEPTAVPNLPVVVPPTPHYPRRQSWLRLSLLVVLVAAGISGGFYWHIHSAPALPPGFASGNGRLEADTIDIETKFAGRISKLLADEGDMVTPGQVVAVMDTQDLEATLKKNEALVRQAE